MADFTLIKLEGNIVSTGAPSWTAIGGANTEVRWSDSNAQRNVASASWPAAIRPAATAIVSYTYAFSADATGEGFYGNGGNCPAYSKDNYLWARWNWDNTGTFASAPIFTAYKTTAHAAFSAGDGTLLGGHSTDTGSRSYLKGNAFGRVDSAGAPSAGPTNAPVVTDGSVGSLSPTAGANWIANYQSLQGDNDYVTAPFTPAATTAGTWSLHFALFTGPNLTPAVYTIVMSLKYTWT